MKKTVRLTESDLTRIVKRIMNEKVEVGMQVGSPQDLIQYFENDNGTWKVEGGEVQFFDRSNTYIGSMK
jgi:hypothetical protein